jgi:type I restriction enzyme, S subunit
MSASVKWPIVRLETLAKSKKNAIVGGPFGSNLVSADYLEEGVPVVRGVNLPKDASFSCDRLVFVSESKADSLKQNLAKPGDLIFTQRGTLGQVGIAPHDTPYERFLISQSQMKMSVDQEKCDPRYLYYFFRMPSTVDYIHNHALQSGVPHINLGILRRFEVVCPPIDIQRKIASVLTAYDDLIENNKRRIILLENMAEEIYREWFVRFRFPGWQEAEFEKGLPAGWSIKKLNDILALQYGKALKNEDRVEGTVPVYGSSGVVGFHNEALVERLGIIVGRKGNVGAIHWSDVAFYPIDTVYYVVSDLSEHFLYYLLHSVNFINNDAAVPGLNRKQAYSNEVLVPKSGLIEQFEVLVKPLYDQKRSLIKMNDNLEKTKKQLLPRLISGKLSVENLDIQFPPSMESDSSDSADEAAA